MENCELDNLKGKNWMAALSLCWFLGMFGAHRFYTAKQNTAWAMVVLTISGFLSPISFIWALIDGIMIVFGNYKHQDGSDLYERVNWFGYLYLILMILGIIVSVVYVILIITIVAVELTNGQLPATP